jgi:hypothetical protein
MDEMRAILRLCRSGLCSVPVRPTAMCYFLLLQLLALELLKVLLENSGPTFRSNERFTAGVHRQGGALVGTDCFVVFGDKQHCWLALHPASTYHRSCRHRPWLSCRHRLWLCRGVVAWCCLLIKLGMCRGVCLRLM